VIAFASTAHEHAADVIVWDCEPHLISTAQLELGREFIETVILIPLGEFDIA
jgi:hypothetical protein